MEHFARFRFFHSLNDFFARPQKNQIIHYAFNGNPSIKDAIEALGVPHTEVDAIVVNHVNIDFSYDLKDGDEVEVYPAKNICLLTANSLTPNPAYPLAFVADVHAGKLAKGLRMLGIDTVYKNNFTDIEVATIAETEKRIVLTRDLGLLKHNKIKWGYWLRSQQTEEQLREVVKHFCLQKQMTPFLRCIECNGAIVTVEKDTITDKIQPNTTSHFQDFYTCKACHRIYWKGSHYERMLVKIKDLQQRLY